MRLGYARLLTQDQDNSAQLAALRKAKCKRVYEEAASGGRWDRPELHRLLDQLRPGDVLVVWRLDRLSRSLKDLLTLLEKVQLARAGFLSLTEDIDTTTPAGRMMMQIVGSFAEFERAMLRKRTRNGLLAARQEGRIGGRRPKLTAATAAGGRSLGGLRRTNGSRCRPVIQCSPLHHCPAAGQGQAGFAGLAYDFFRFLRRPVRSQMRKSRSESSQPSASRGTHQEPKHTGSAPSPSEEQESS